jgi:hypothetical protein
MPEADKLEVLSKFRRKLADQDTEGLRVHLQIAGGMPGEQYSRQEVTLLGARRVKVLAEGADGAPGEAESTLDEAKAYELLQKLGDGADDLVDRSEARFIPDSVVGSVTIEVDGEETTLYFLADEEEREAQRQYLSPATAEALDQLADFARRALDQGRGQP